MKIESFSLYNDHEIKCTLYLPKGEPELVIVGVHGFGGDRQSSALKRLAMALEPDGGALICFDFPCHGESPLDEKGLTVQGCIDDLLFVQRYAATSYPAARQAVFATSFGGYIALLCSHQLLDCTLVLRAPAVTMPEILLSTVLKTERETFEKAGTARCGFERKMDLPYSFYLDLSRREDLAKKPLSQRALIIHGSCDEIVPPAHIEKYAKSHPDVRLETVEGADHRFKHPGELERVIELTKKFLK